LVSFLPIQSAVTTDKRQILRTNSEHYLSTTTLIGQLSHAIAVTIYQVHQTHPTHRRHPRAWPEGPWEGGRAEKWALSAQSPHVIPDLIRDPLAPVAGAGEHDNSQRN